MHKKAIEKKILSISILLFLISAFVSIYIPELKAKPESPDTIFRVWVHSDEHVRNGSWLISLQDAIDDADTYFEWDISIVIGDLIHNEPYDAQNEYDDWKSVRNNSDKDREYFYCIPGNHEHYGGPSYYSYWSTMIDPTGDNGQVKSSNRPYALINPNDDSYPLSNSTDDRYFFTVGNLLFLLMGPNYDRQTNYTDHLEWFSSIIENNTHMNIIICTHLPLPTSGITRRSGDLLWKDYGKFTNFLNNTPNHTINVWMNGHLHYKDGGTRYVDNSTNIYNISFINIASITRDSFGSCADSKSWLLTFTDNSDKVTLGQWSHCNNVWEPSGNPGNRTFNLTYPFDKDYVYGQGSQEQEIYSISMQILIVIFVTLVLITLFIPAVGELRKNKKNY